LQVAGVSTTGVVGYTVTSMMLNICTHFNTRTQTYIITIKLMTHGLTVLANTLSVDSDKRL